MTRQKIYLNFYGLIFPLIAKECVIFDLRKFCKVVRRGFW